MRSGDIRPCDGDIASARAAGDESSLCTEIVSDDGGTNFWLFRVGNGDLIAFADEIEVDCEDPFFQSESPFIEPSLDGEFEWSCAGPTVKSLSVSTDVPLDRPGKGIPWGVEIFSNTISP